MTEGTAEIQRLDYSKPPPGAEKPGIWGPPLSDVWSVYKASNDPPGLVVEEALDDESGNRQVLWHVIEVVTKNIIWWRGCPDTDAGEHEGEAAARAAAWTWYDRRLALAERLTSLAVEARALGHLFVHEGSLPWPTPLRLSDADCDAVTAYLDSKGAPPVPEVLR